MLKSLEGNFNNPQVHGLLVRHFIELRSVSPKGSAHVLDISGLKDQSIKFWSLWEGYELVGIGALKFLNAIHGEFKSIRVNDKFRNKQNGLKVVNHLVYQAKKLGIEELSLETGAGVFFNPARKLFIKCGFKVCDPFSHYVEDINSVYMSRLISNH
jgi:putative acetyltransferase|tara:strand:+ start:1076 stop:1543 length:468 start_codon:yes stop_codon:yes gene_type:complete